MNRQTCGESNLGARESDFVSTNKILRYVSYSLTVVGVATSVAWSAGALAQYKGASSAAPGTAVSSADVLNASALESATAGQVRCPSATVVKLDNDAIITWNGQDGNACKRELRLSTGEVTQQLWYAPTFTMNTNASKDFANQLKPSRLWPLEVGKTLTGRFDGPGSDPGYMGSWVYKITVADHTKLSTKAGAFDVYVVTREEEAIGGTFKSKLREWYAPSLGVSVRTAYGDNVGVSSVQEAVSVKR